MLNKTCIVAHTFQMFVFTQVRRRLPKAQKLANEPWYHVHLPMIIVQTNSSALYWCLSLVARWFDLLALAGTLFAQRVWNECHSIYQPWMHQEKLNWAFRVKCTFLSCSFPLKRNVTNFPLSFGMIDINLYVVNCPGISSVSFQKWLR